MDNNQGPTPSAVTEKSQSSSCHRVMWNVSDGEEEVYESVVNYRSLSPDDQSIKSSSSKSDQDRLTTSKFPHTSATDVKKEKPMQDLTTPQGMPNTSSICLAMRYKPSLESMQDLATAKRARVIGCWHNLFDQIRQKKLDNTASPTLGLRYKPSHESLKNRCSNGQIAKHSWSTNSPKRNLAAAVKLETCCLPPYQTAIVREVAPKFANRKSMPDDSDSCCSGCNCRTSLLKSSRSRKIFDMGLSPLAHSKSSINAIEETNGDHNTRHRTNSAEASNATTPKGNGSKPAPSRNSTNAMPNLRQRQQELHRIRVQIEKRRLELLDLKIVRERAEALRHEILFQKDLQLKYNQIKAYEDNSSSQA